MSKPVVTKLEKSRVEIKATIPADVFNGYKAKALQNLGKTAKIDGFRPGHIPTNVLEKELGDAVILDEMAQQAILNAYPTILAEQKIDAIGRPEIQLTKIAHGNDLEFTITTAVMPTISLGNYKKVAKEINKDVSPVVVTDNELDAAIVELRQMRAHQQMHDDGVEHHDHDHTKISTDNLPEIDDAFVKTLGAFEGVEDFKTKFKENLLKEKESKELEKNRAELVEKMIEETPIDLPDMLADFELDKMMQQFAYDISSMGMTMEDYLKRIEKTEDQIKSEWRINAEKRAKMQLILDKIAEEEKLLPTEEEIQTEIEKIIEMYKDQADISEERARSYVTQVLANAKVFAFLEGLK